MFEKMTIRARSLMSRANSHAQRRCHEYVGTEHLLLAMVDNEECGICSAVLKDLGVEQAVVVAEINKLCQSGPDLVTMGKLPHTPRLKQALEYALEESVLLNHKYVGTEHLLLGLARVQEGIAADVWRAMNLTEAKVRDGVMKFVGPGEQEREIVVEYGQPDPQRKFSLGQVLAANKLLLQCGSLASAIECLQHTENVVQEMVATRTLHAQVSVMFNKVETDKK